MAVIVVGQGHLPSTLAVCKSVHPDTAFYKLLGPLGHVLPYSINILSRWFNAMRQTNGVRDVHVT